MKSRRDIVRDTLLRIENGHAKAACSHTSVKVTKMQKNHLRPFATMAEEESSGNPALELETDVAIIGAGPVGLHLAAELAYR